jgi:ectoine hydroxylase-related dioxygenase (phytanoyl-CoA dioxygenase family)
MSSNTGTEPKSQENWNQLWKAHRPENTGVSGPQFAPTFLADAEAEAAAAAAEQRVHAEILRLDLAAHVEELDQVGYTVLSPEAVGCLGIVDQLLGRVIDVAGRRMGIAVDVQTGRSHSEFKTPFGQAQWEGSLLLEDEMFERVLMNEYVLALITYLLGESCTLNHFSCLVKGPGVEYLPLHTDQNQSGACAPYQLHAQVANATWALTDYSIENGAICFVPGSHKYCRPPSSSEAIDLALYQPLEVPAGSVIIWHGNTWHGALPRTNPGVRVNLIEYFQRWYLPPGEDISTRISKDALARNVDRFAILTGVVRPIQLLDSPWSKAAKLGRYA